MSAEGVALHSSPRPLAELETVIERGLETFVEVGAALLEIRERRLYRETHDSFEAYCRERWRWTRGRANQMIRASEVVGLLDTPVSNEAQARQLGRLRDDLRGMREVWDEVRSEHGDDATAADVRAAVDRRLDVFPPTDRQAAMLKVMEDAAHLLEEPEHEKVYYRLSRFRLSMHVDPSSIAEVSHVPAQDAPSWAALAAWVGAIAEAMQVRANGLRVLGDRRP